MTALGNLLDWIFDTELNHRRNTNSYNDIFDLNPLETLDIVRPKLRSRFNPYTNIIQKLHDLDCLATVLDNNNRRLTRNDAGKNNTGVRGGGKISGYGKDGFQACMNVEHFAPNELTVKIVDGCIVVEGKHDEHPDNYGFISRQFQRRFILPNEYDVNLVTSSLSSDGILTIHVPRPKKLEESNERIIQIQQTGPAHLSIKENHKDESVCDGGDGDGEGNKPDKKDKIQSK